MSRQCPRCRVDFELVKKPFAEIDLCPRCGGIFLDRGEGVALHGADSDPSFLVEDGRAHLVRASELGCPSAAHGPVAMQVFAVGFGGDAIEFEHCPQCRGIFLDRGEDEELEAAAGNGAGFTTAGGARFSAPPSVDRQAQAIEAARAEKDRGLFATFFRDLVSGTGEVLRDGAEMTRRRRWGRRHRG